MTAIERPFAGGIIAAGDGIRLKDAFPGTVKPMVRIAGRPLCGWVAGGLIRTGAASVTMISNTRCGAARDFLKASFPDPAWRFIVEDTASSWESFRLVARSLSDEPDFVISTADALVPPEKTARFILEMRRLKASCGLGLTDFIDDEKPLWADMAPDGSIRSLGEGCAVRRWATAGLYYMTGARARSLPSATAHRSLRWFLAAEAGLGSVRGWCLGKTVDVDRPEDVKTAEQFVKENFMRRHSAPTAARLPGGEAC
ncbi:MAG: hypothetical protein HZB91_13995 [Elusimicrobia bacterium]|nr:hypothetical protein [Elusimicrobiota bacterium]